MSKRRRLRKNAQRSQAHDTDLSQSLTCVRVVCLDGPDTLRLPHVAAKLDELLDGSPKWTLTALVPPIVRAWFDAFFVFQ
jgi:hypothetical protein